VTYYLVAPLAIVMALLQTTIMPRLRVFGVSPDLVLLFTVTCGLLWGVRKGIVVGLVGGLVLDMSSSAFFGLSATGMAIVALISGLGGANVFPAARVVPFVVVLLASVVNVLLFALVLRLTGDPLIGWAILWRVMLPVAVVNTVCLPLVYGSARWLHRRLSPPVPEFPR
jgi:rod shape-determining protein MreD